MQDLPNGGGGGTPIQALAPGRWRPSGRHCLQPCTSGYEAVVDPGHLDGGGGGRS